MTPQTGLALTYASNAVKALGDLGDWLHADQHDEETRLDKARFNASMAEIDAQRLLSEVEKIKRELA